MSDDGVINRQSRKACHAARDAYFACMNSNLSGPSEPASTARSACAEFKAAFDKACPASWVLHFEKRWQNQRLQQALERKGYQQIKLDVDANPT
eukprot:m.56071 g.56071  ORF g.56071 m.56071 type:complete len:94 (-) comp12577_c0_seq1:18-299(-)